MMGNFPSFGGAGGGWLKVAKLAHGLRDGSENPADGCCAKALWRSCSVQPEQ